MHAQSPSLSEAKNLSPDKKWEYDCPQSIECECAPEVIKAGTNETVVDLDGDLNVYGKYSTRSNIAWAPDSKRFAFNFSQPAAHAFYETLAFYELHGDKWEMLESLAKANPISKAISKAISGGLAVERTKKHIKAKATAAIGSWQKCVSGPIPIQLLSTLTKKMARKRGRLFASTFSLL
jgi:hypothetical protein